MPGPADTRDIARCSSLVLIMRIITADETGLVKVVRLESGECLSVSSVEQGRTRAVSTICHNQLAVGSATPTGKQRAAGFCGSIHVARSAGAVETWDMSREERTGTNGDGCTLSFSGKVDCPSGPLALASLSPGPSSKDGRVLTCNAEGEVQVSSCPSSSSGHLKPVTFSVRGPISAAVAVGTTAGEAKLAAGGKDNDLATWDVNTAQCTWKAKNLPHDFLDMRQPVWISSLRSLVPETENDGSDVLQQIVAGTAHRQVRLYDARAGRRPTHSIDADEHGVTTMAVAPGGKEVVVADTAGLVRVLDLRKMKWGRRFSGPAGSVRGLAFHPTLPALACVGLDRVARVYDYKSKEQTFQVYLKQRLNAVLFDGEGEVRVTAGTADGEGSKGTRGNNGDGGSESEGWGSGEEYEMDESESSEEEEDGDGGLHGTMGSRRRADGAAANGSAPSSRSVQDEGSSSGSNEEDDSSSGEEDGDDSNDSYEEDEDEEARAPPSKPQNAKNVAYPSSKKRRR